MNRRRTRPLKTLGALVLVVLAVIVTLVYLQFRGVLQDTTRLTMRAARAGLVMDPGSKVTYNGAPIGRVASVNEVNVDGKPMAELGLDIGREYLELIPANVDAAIIASTVFGNKYVAFSTPATPATQNISSTHVIDASAVTTEVNTLFETITDISKKVDPVKLNMTLSATAEALTGLGTKFGESIVNANTILDEVNPRMPQIRTDIQKLADTADIYSDASPDLWSFLDKALTTVSTLTEQQRDLDEALTAAAGFGSTAANVVERTSPYFVRDMADLRPTSQLLDTYSPQIRCTIRNYDDLADQISLASRSGYSVTTLTRALGAENPYVYPDNLPRVNARGGPGGAPGCWQAITKNLWPAPHLVMDTGASITPYNHFELGHPFATEYIWGRQIGENTINP